MDKYFVLLALVASAQFLYDSAEARCRRHDRKCCREKIRYGGSCHGHHRYGRRWGYNISCGRCVPFDGCGEYDNDFISSDECNDCCSGTPPCAHYSLPAPPRSCGYKWYDGPDYCPRPKLECNCQKSYCRPDSCRSGQRCVPRRHESCRSCPCQQYQCISDPCFAVSKQLRPCEKCLALPAPTCHEQPCPLIAYRENRCQEHVPVQPLPPIPVPYVAPVLPYQGPPRHCSVYVECPAQGDGCHSRGCPAYPSAKCVTDPCDCRKNWWSCVDGRTVSNEECFNGKR